MNPFRRLKKKIDALISRKVQEALEFDTFILALRSGLQTQTSRMDRIEHAAGTFAVTLRINPSSPGPEKGAYGDAKLLTTASCRIERGGHATLQIKDRLERHADTIEVYVDLPNGARVESIIVRDHLEVFVTGGTCQRAFMLARQLFPEDMVTVSAIWPNEGR